MKKYTLLFLLVFVVSCQKQTKKDNKSNDSLAISHNAKNSLDYIGTYKGILPCADCEG